MDDVSKIMESALMEFPMSGVEISLPERLCSLPSDNNIISSIIEEIRTNTSEVSKMKDFYQSELLFY
jgi:hypothetical protein